MTNNPTIDGVSREEFESANPVPFGVFWSEPDSRYMTTMVHLNCLEYNGKWLGWQSGQSTIAQLQARIAELESVRGEPVAEVEHGPFDDVGAPQWVRVVTLGDYDLEHIPDGTKFYTAPPAPVAVVLPEQLIAAIDAEQKRLSAEDYLMDSDDCIAVIREVAGLDATAALNEGRK